MGEVKVVGIGGSLSSRSSSLAALEIALAGADEAGARTELFDVRELDLPMYDPWGREPPVSAERLAEAAHAADGLIWSAPMYHGTVSGSFKNALDWLQLLARRDPPYLTHKVVGLISAAGGEQGIQAINTMERVVRALHAWPVPLVVAIPRAFQAFDPEGRPREEALANRLRKLGSEVARSAFYFAWRGAHVPEHDGLGSGRWRPPMIT